jgi:xyloglucan-specific exo-beta-1,4-glucanase
LFSSPQSAASVNENSDAVGGSLSAFSVYRSTDDGQSWTRLDTDQLGFASVVSIAADRQKPGRVYVGTNGRGIFFAE